MTTLTVSQINRYIKSLFDEIPPIQNIYVMGEISNLSIIVKADICILH